MSQRQTKTARNAAIVVQARTPGTTLAQVGAVHGLSRERVRQIVNRAGVTAPRSHGQTCDEWLARITELVKQPTVTSWRDISVKCCMHRGWARSFAAREDPGLYVFVSAILEERRARRPVDRIQTPPQYADAGRVIREMESQLKYTAAECTRLRRELEDS